MKTLLALLILIPSLSWGNEKVIYCYKYDSSLNFDNADGIINQMIDSKSFKNSTQILYFEINDKKKIFQQIKKYQESGPEQYSHLKSKMFNFYYGNNTEILDATTIFYNKNEITIRYTYKNRVDEREMIAFYELDRVTGILLYKWGTYIDENGDWYSENSEDKKLYEKDDSYEYKKELNYNKYICETHKGI